MAPSETCTVRIHVESGDLYSRGRALAELGAQIRATPADDIEIQEQPESRDTNTRDVVTAALVITAASTAVPHLLDLVKAYITRNTGIKTKFGAELPDGRKFEFEVPYRVSQSEIEALLRELQKPREDGTP